MDIDELLKQPKEVLLRGLQIANARSNFMDFVQFTKADYRAQWFHKQMAEACDKFARREIMRLMFFTPPQHGKSELTSRRLPAYMFGLNPDLRIAGLSYNDKLAKKFNRQVQRIIDSDEYHTVFPDISLNRSNVVTSAKGEFLRNANEFEIVGHLGSYMSAGVGVGIAGNPMDVILIDDPIKSRKDADSKTYRETLWEWWTDDVQQRIRNFTQVMITVTRWHEDDLIGRILSDEEEAAKWTIIRYPALKEDNFTPDDPREIGEALWEEEKSRESLLEIERKTPRTFVSLYQQKPTPKGGTMFKRNWFNIISPGDYVNRLKYANKKSPKLFVIDTAYTADTSNDPNGFMAFNIMDEEIYIFSFIAKHLELPAFIKFLQKYLKAFNYARRSKVFVEPKATGKSVVQMMKRIRHDKKLINITEDVNPDTDKESRAAGILDICETGRINLIEGPWNKPFLDELCGFPRMPHDESVDLIIMAIDKLENGWGDYGGLSGSTT